MINQRPLAILERKITEIKLINLYFSTLLSKLN